MAWITLAFVVVVVATTVWLAKRPPTTSCDDRSWLPSTDNVVFASQVVMKPWYGRHNVYGVFVIPDQYRGKEYSATVVVRGVKGHADLSPRPTKEHGIIIVDVPDRFVKHAHVHSRTALWFLLAGHFGDIRSTCNWALVFTDQKAPGSNQAGNNSRPE